MTSLFDWLLKRRKPLSQMTRSELRRKELLLEKDRNQLLNKINKLAADKQALFDRGAKEKTPEVRRALAQEFEMKTSEQLMLSRQLNVRSKEMLTVSRLRMLRENADRARETGGRLGLVSEKDLLRLGTLIENDSIKTEMYQQRLDDILKIGVEVEDSGIALSETGQSVLDVWDQMDRGAIVDAGEGFDEADRRVREQQAAPEE
jgi:hypothetical protein